MSRDAFALALKSTIDKTGADLAGALGIAQFLDMDDTANASVILQGEEDVIAWQFSTLDESPVDPLYTAIFSVGAKTTSDASNYDMLQFISKVQSTFRKGSTLNIYNYSGLVADPILRGTMSIVQSGVEAQEYDKQSGYRFVSIIARVVREM
jgi:hypothetical protein